MMREIAFTLVVDDFAMKYVDKADVDHLLLCIKERYPVKVDWDAKQYIRVNLDWSYEEHEVLLSMKDYVKQDLAQLRNTKTISLWPEQSTPHPIWS